MGLLSRASVDAGTVRDRFNLEWCTSDPVQDLDTYWWWARSVRVDPNEVIADDGEGGLWSIPFTTDGADAITFSAPVRVAEQYMPVAARREGDGAAAMDFVRRRGQKVIASALERPNKPERGGSSTSRSSNPTGRSPMSRITSQPSPAAASEQNRVLVDRAALSRRLGLAENATAAQITAALDGPQVPTSTPAQPVASTGVVASAAERTRLLAAAESDGRILASTREIWDRALAADPDARRQLASLASSSLPRAAGGASEPGEPSVFERIHGRTGATFGGSARELQPASTSLGRAQRAVGGPSARSVETVLGSERPRAPRASDVAPGPVIRKGG